MNDIIDALQNNDDNKKDNYGMLLKVNKSKKGKKSHPKKDKGTYKKKTLDKKYTETEDNTDDLLQTEEYKIKKNEDLKRDNFVENNISLKEIINNALFTQLSEMKVNLVDSESQSIYKSKKKSLPKIDYIEFNLLSQGIGISQFKKYGYGIYVFFLYLINKIITFGLLMIFAFYYIYQIFFKYYQDFEAECDVFFECNILSLASGVQIRKFRNYYISKHGKKAFLKKYENFDVLYKEYLFPGTTILIIIFIIDFIYIIFLKRSYKAYKDENPEINNYSLILSGKNLPCLSTKNIIEDKNNIEKEKERIKDDIINKLNVNPKNISYINFTLQMKDYYEKMEELDEKKGEKIKIQHHRKKNKKCYCEHFLTFRGFWYCCCNRKRKLSVEVENSIQKDIDEIIKGLEEKIKEEEYNPLYIITFKTKQDYEEVYSRYPHSYFKESIKNIFRKKTDIIYINKAPNPEDIAWENLEFNKEDNYFRNIFTILGLSLAYLGGSFILQLGIELIGHIGGLDSLKIISLIVGLVTSIIQEKIDDWFSDCIDKKINNYITFWSISDKEYYSIIIKSIFKFINLGLFTLLTQLSADAIFGEEEDDYYNLVNKLFVVIEMDGFGYPLIDLLYFPFKKGKNMYKKTEKIFSDENINKGFQEQIDNIKGYNRYKLEKTFRKPEFEIGDNYSDILNIYWTTMFYMSIYPIGIFQSFLNLLFKFILEKNFLINIYKRPSYISPHFGFFCFNFFNFGFFLFLLGEFIFFKNEDNEKSFGIIYIIIMILILIIPFYLLGNFFMYITNFCCLKKKEVKNLNDINEKIKSDYRIFNPCYQKEEIKKLFSEFKGSNNDDSLLNKFQYQEIEKKIEQLNYLDLYKLQESLRIPREMTFIEKKLVSNLYEEGNEVKEKKKKLYHLLMRFGFFSFVEEGNIIKPKKNKIDLGKEKIRSLSLKSLKMQENLTNSGSGCFTCFYYDNKLMMAYVDSGTTVRIFNVEDKIVWTEIKDKKHTKKIVGIENFQDKKKDIIYIITVALDNTMIITEISYSFKQIKSTLIENIGETFSKYENDKNNIFSVSTVQHNNELWIITSYYYDRKFKIYKLNKDPPKVVDCFNNFIISLQGFFLTDENTYILIRATENNINQKIILYINDAYIKDIIVENDYYINFKIIKPFDLILEKKYIYITKINKNLSYYNIQIKDISQILPLYTSFYISFIQGFGERLRRITNFFRRFNLPFTWVNKDAHTELAGNDLNSIQKIRKNTEYIENIFELNNINLQADYRIKSEMIKFFESSDVDKYNIGNILNWEEDYIIVGTPFDYLDVIDVDKGKKVGVINNSQTNIIDAYGNIQNINNIVAYNLSNRYNVKDYGDTFLMRDNKGKIQFIRTTHSKDRLNYKINIPDNYFNNLPEYEKLNRMGFSFIFYLFYTIINILIPFFSGLAGLSKDESEKEVFERDYKNAIIIFYSFYAALGFLFKECVNDINDTSHSQRKNIKGLMYFFLIGELIFNSIMAYYFCASNKSGIYLIIMILIIYSIQFLFHIIVYCAEIKYLLRTYWLGFLFYQISRFCIFLFFALSFLFDATNKETYIYSFILCILSAYMYMANYFNTLLQDLTYSNIVQALFNYPLEWMNLFCCWCCQPKECIREIDYNCYCWEDILACLLDLLKLFVMCLIYCIYYLFQCICCMFSLGTSDGGN